MKVISIFLQKGMQPTGRVVLTINGPSKEVKEVLFVVEKHFEEKDWEQK